MEDEIIKKFVSRGGEKLEAAIKSLAIDVKEKVCADVGASTGGFTDCLLQNGAKKVYAIDVGYGILDWKLRNNPKVVLMERQNVRFLQNLLEPVDLVTIDVSFISLKLVLPVVKNWLMPKTGRLVALIKPQFEASYKEASRGKGVIKDSHIIEQILSDLQKFAKTLGFKIKGLIPSPILGKKGNQEFLICLSI